MKNKKGFTLIELLVVIAIIGLLSTLAIVSLNTAREKSRDSKRASDIRVIQSAVELYVNETGNPPENDASPTWLELDGKLGKYVVGGSLPTPTGAPECNIAAADPVGDCYTYCENATTGTYLLVAEFESGGVDSITGDLDGPSASYAAINDCVTNIGPSLLAQTITCADPTFCLGTL